MTTYFNVSPIQFVTHLVTSCSTQDIRTSLITMHSGKPISAICPQMSADTEQRLYWGSWALIWCNKSLTEKVSSSTVLMITYSKWYKSMSMFPMVIRKLCYKMFCHRLFNGKCQKFDIRCVKLSCHSNSVVHILKGEGSWWIFLGGQRYFVRNGSNSRWNASYVDGICQAVSSDILERSCSSLGRGKVMISFLGRARPFYAYKKLFDMDCSLWSRNKSPFIAGHSQ